MRNAAYWLIALLKTGGNVHVSVINFALIFMQGGWWSTNLDIWNGLPYTKDNIAMAVIWKLDQFQIVWHHEWQRSSCSM